MWQCSSAVSLVTFQEMKTRPPFLSVQNSVMVTHFRNSRGKDTFNYKESFCYEYDQLLFDGMTPQEFLDSQPKSRPPISDLPQDADYEAEYGLSAIPDSTDTISSPSIGTCGEWCWKVDLENTNVSCTDICVSQDIGGPAVKVFVTGHGKFKLVSKVKAKINQLCYLQQQLL